MQSQISSFLKILTNLNPDFHLDKIFPLKSFLRSCLNIK